MKSVKFKVIAAIIVGATLFGTVSPALATPISQEAIQEVQTKQQEYDAIEKRITQFHMEMDEILDNITYIMSLIDENNLKIEAVEETKKVKEAEIAENEIKLDEKNVEYGERLRAMYKQGNSGILDALLGSDSIADFVSRTDAIIKIAKIDQELLDAIEAIKVELTAQREGLQSDIDALYALNDENKKNLAAVEVKKVEAEAKLAEVKAEEAKIMADLIMREAYLIGGNEAIINDSNSTDADLLAAMASLREGRQHIITDTADAKFIALIESAKSTLDARKVAREQEAQRLAEIAAKEAATKKPSNPSSNNSSSSNSSSSVTSSASGQAIANYAHNFLGIPYVWGGNTTSGLDCSGLTRMVFSKFGISLDRVSRDQATQGKYIPISQAQPGDLLYFGQSQVTHVGIYIGNGQMIHAPKPGDVVKISSISWHLNNYSIQGARRFTN